MKQLSNQRSPSAAGLPFALFLIALTISLLGPRITAAQAPTTESEATEPAATEPAADVSCTGIGCDDETEVDAEAEEEAPEDRRARIELPVEGGQAVLLAEKVNFQPGEFVVAEGDVEMRYQDLVMTADVARYDVTAELLTAEGRVVLDEGPQRLTGDTLEYNIVDRTGRLSNAKAHVRPDYYFTGAELAKTGPETYTITDGIFTSCEGDVPPWSIALSSAKITLEKYAKIKNARMRFKNVPVLYAPYVLWPAKTDRASGFLVPKPGYSSRRGGYLGLAYFQTLGRSADLTLFGDLYSNQYFGTGAELRWRPSEGSRGFLQGYLITEPDDQDIYDPLTNPGGEFRQIFDPFRQPGDDRWKVALFHESNDLWKGFRGVIAVTDYSDFDYPGDYERDVLRSSQPYIYSNAYLSGNFGNQSLNIMVDRRERILNQFQGIDLRHQLPEIDYRIRPTQLGNTPIYFSLLSSFNAFLLESEVRDLNTGEPIVTPTLSYERGDLLPIISIPLSSLTWLSAKLDVGGRITHYTDSLNDTRTEFTGESLTRTFATAGLEVVGPSFSRIFEKSGGRFVKFKHIVEPRLDFTFVDDFDDQEIIPFFDEVDPLVGRNDVVFSITNRLIAKPKPKRDDEGKELPEEGAFEIASFSLAQGFSFDADKPLQRSRDGMLLSDESAIFANLRFNPSRRTSLRADAAYNTLFDAIESTALTGGVALGAYADVGVTWFTRTNAETGVESRNQAQLYLKLALVPNRLFLDTAHRFDLRSETNNFAVQERLLEQYYRLRWEGSCFSMQFEYLENNFQNALGEEFRFSLTLKHVGTFLDLNAL